MEAVQARLGYGKEDDRDQEDLLDAVVPVGVHDHGRHQDERGDEHRQIDDPVRIDGEPCLVAQHQRQHHEARRHDQMQDENAEIQAQQLSVGENLPELRGHRLGVTVKADLRRRGHEAKQYRNAQQGHDAGQPEQTGQTDQRLDRRARDHRERECHADADADDGHRLGALLLAGQIGGEGEHGGGDGAESLQGAAGDDPPDAVGAGRHGALPMAKITRPPTMTFLRPMRSESLPKGIWKTAWVSP